jgi:selenocysteine lyase/cysteine desulfurase
VYPWQAAAADTGARVRTVHRPEDGDWTAAVLDELDEHVGVVAVPHCHWTDGGLVDLVAVGERCRRTGAALVVDAVQSLGALPLDLGAVRPDFLVATGYKWLLGPYSIGFLYADPRHHAGRPVEHNWITRLGSEDFAGLVGYRDEFQPGARRFDVGERSNFALMPVMIASLEQLLEWGIDLVAASTARLTARIAEGAGSVGWTSLPPGRRAGHLLGLRRQDGAAPSDVAGLLAAARVYVSVRGTSIRVAPHVYNSDADADRLLEVLSQAARG